MSLHRSRRAAPLLAASAAVALLAGCASSDDGGGSASPTSGGTGQYSDEALQTFANYTGGTLGKATGEPITLGWFNSQGGVNDYSQYTDALTAALDLINNELGGVDGRPLELNECFVADSDEQGQVCGQQFLNDDSVIGVLQGTVFNGQSSFHQTLDGQLPVLGTIASGVSDGGATNAYYLTGGQLATSDMLTYAKDYLHVSSVAIMGPTGIPAASEGVAQLVAQFEAAGIEVTQSTYSAAATDYTASIVASRAAEADLFIPFAITTQQCVAVAQGVEQLAITTPIAAFDLCVSDTVSDSLGDYPDWTYQFAAVNPLADSSDETTTEQSAAYAQWQQATGVTAQQSSVLTLQLALTAAKVLTGLGDDLTTDSLSAALGAFTGPSFLGLGDLSFGSNPQLAAVGTLASRFYTYGGDGQWDDATDGEVVTPPTP